MNDKQAQQVYDAHPEVEEEVTKGLAATERRTGHPGKADRDRPEDYRQETNRG